MKQEDVTFYGDQAKLRQMLEQIDKMLTLTGDSSLFRQVHPNSIAAIANPLLSARTAVSNVLIEYGDTRGLTTPIPKQEYRAVQYVARIEEIDK